MAVRVIKLDLSSAPVELEFKTLIDPPRFIELISVERYTGTVRWTDPEAVDEVVNYRLVFFRTFYRFPKNV